MKNQHKENPAEFKPEGPKDLLGKAGKIAVSLLSHTAKVKHEGGRFKLMLYGAPGTGKTTMADMIAACLAQARIDIESINGRNVTIDVVRAWQQANVYGSLFGGWRVKIINEADLIPVVAQDLLLTYLDEMGDKCAIIGTSNENIGTLSGRFRSRFQCVHVPAPTQAEIAEWLRKKFSVAKKGAEWISVGCGGNVRQALLDAGTLLMTGFLPDKIEQEMVVCSSRSDAAKRAWDTMRAKAVTA